MTNPEPIVRHLALIGAGLIGGFDRASAHTSARPDSSRDHTLADSRARGEPVLPISRLERARERYKDTDLVIIWIQVGACEAVAKEIDAFEVSCDSLRRRLVEEGWWCATWRLRARKRAFHSGASGGGHGKFRPGFRLRPSFFVNRWCILTPSKAPIRRRRSCPDFERARRQCRDHDGGSPRPRARGDEPSAAAIAYTIVGTADELANVPIEVLNSPPAASATSPASRRPTRPCGATCSCTTSTPCWRCSAPSTRICRSSPRAIRRGDGDALFEHFTRTRAIRRGIVQIGQDLAAPDFGRAHPACRTRRCRSLTASEDYPNVADGDMQTKTASGLPTLNGPR